MEITTSKHGEEAIAFFPFETTRAERIIAVCTMIEFKNRLMLKKITSIGDRKGLLTITWSEKPSLFEVNIISDVWEFLNESQIEHFYNEELLLK